jgi:hypothetical protein
MRITPFRLTAVGVALLAGALPLRVAAGPDVARSERSLADRRVLELSDQSLELEKLYETDFATPSDLEGWIFEGTESVAVRSGRLVIDAREGSRPYATGWCPKRFEGDELVELVVSSRGGRDNLNLFLFGAERDGSSVLQSSGRRTGRYREYHELANYVVTFLNEGERGRVRLRSNPGFELLQEASTDPIEPGRDYHLSVAVQGPRLRFYIDRKKVIDHTEPRPAHRRGHHALRTWRTLFDAEAFRVSRILGPEG